MIQDPDRVEYLLPAVDISDDVRGEFHPWISGFIGLNSDTATVRVAERWREIHEPSFIELRGVLETFEVRSVVDCDYGSFVKAVRPGSDESIVGNTWYLPAPMERSDIRKRLRAIGIDHLEPLIDFLHYFGGLAEDPVYAGQFVSSEDPLPVFDDSYADDDTDGYSEWEGSLMLYHSRGGCHLMVRKDGQIGWWMMQEHRVAPVAQTLEEFIPTFTLHRRHAEPFDPYGIPEDKLYPLP